MLKLNTKVNTDYIISSCWVDWLFVFFLRKCVDCSAKLFSHGILNSISVFLTDQVPACLGSRGYLLFELCRITTRVTLSSQRWLVNVKVSCVVVGRSYVWFC